MHGTHDGDFTVGGRGALLYENLRGGGCGPAPLLLHPARVPMSSLGSIFEPASGADRGPDLRATVRVPASAPGRAAGWRVTVPRVFALPSGPVERARHPDDDGDRIRLFLPETLRSGATLRLRGQGGLSEGRAPGDLYLTVEVDPSLPPEEEGNDAVMRLRAAPVALVGTVAVSIAIAAAWALCR